MKSYFQNSLVFIIPKKICFIYEQSRLKKVIDVLGSWYSNSTTKKSFLGFVQRKSYATSTFSYRFLSFFGKKADSVVSKIHAFSVVQNKSSLAGNLFLTAKSEFMEKLPLPIAVIISFYALGYSLSITTQGMWSTRKLAVVAILLLAAVILYAVKNQWKVWLKESFIYKVCRYF